MYLIICISSLQPRLPSSFCVCTINKEHVVSGNTVTALRQRGLRRKGADIRSCGVARSLLAGLGVALLRRRWRAEGRRRLVDVVDDVVDDVACGASLPLPSESLCTGVKVVRPPFLYPVRAFVVTLPPCDSSATAGRCLAARPPPTLRLPGALGSRVAAPLAGGAATSTDTPPLLVDCEALRPAAGMRSGGLVSTVGFGGFDALGAAEPVGEGPADAGSLPSVDAVATLVSVLAEALAAIPPPAVPPLPPPAPRALIPTMTARSWYSGERWGACPAMGDTFNWPWVAEYCVGEMESELSDPTRAARVAAAPWPGADDASAASCAAMASGGKPLLERRMMEAALTAYMAPDERRLA